MTNLQNPQVTATLIAMILGDADLMSRLRRSTTSAGLHLSNARRIVLAGFDNAMIDACDQQSLINWPVVVANVLREIQRQQESNNVL